MDKQDNTQDNKDNINIEGNFEEAGCVADRDNDSAVAQAFELESATGNATESESENGTEHGYGSGSESRGEFEHDSEPEIEPKPEPEFESDSKPKPESTSEPAKKPVKKNSIVKELIRDVVIILAIVGVVTFFIKPIIVKQTSMLPTLQEDNYIFLNKQAYNFGSPKRGDIVVFPVSSEIGEELYIKRVIGLPGDVIDVTDGKVYVNGKEQDDSYTNDGVTPGEVDGFEVPEGELYVMGDNRVVSIDSRDPEVGTVPIEDVTGVAFLRIYPFSEFGTVGGI